MARKGFWLEVVVATVLSTCIHHLDPVGVIQRSQSRHTNGSGGEGWSPFDDGTKKSPSILEAAEKQAAEHSSAEAEAAEKQAAEHSSAEAEEDKAVNAAAERLVQKRLQRKAAKEAAEHKKEAAEQSAREAAEKKKAAKDAVEKKSVEKAASKAAEKQASEKAAREAAEKEAAEKAAGEAAEKEVAEKAGELKVVFEPGHLGITADWTTGVVTRITKEKQAHRSGVLVGMRLLTVDGEPYTKKRWDAAKTGSHSYGVTFAEVTADVAKKAKKEL